MSARKEVVCEERAQATVELAVVAPVLVVLALVSYNMMVFVSATARFDRVAPDIVLAHGSSPPASEPDTAAETWGVADAVAGELERAMEGYEVEIEVEVSEEGRGGLDDTGVLGLVGPLRDVTCVMRYRPWPQGWSIAGVELGAPLFMEHERCVTIDPWRSGVIV